MLGGTMVNMTGPCFTPDMRIICRFNTIDTEGVVIDENRASCVTPWIEAEGWVDFEISLDGGPFYWKGSFYVGKFQSCQLNFITGKYFQPLKVENTGLVDFYKNAVKMQSRPR